MDIKRFFMALPAVATMLLAASCGNQDMEIIEAPQASEKHTIPFEAVVNSPVQTRGTLNADGDAYVFQTGDRLFVVGGNANTTITAELTLNPADAGKSTGAHFTGTLDYTGDAPTAETGLSAWLKGVNDQLLPATAAALAAANGQVTFPTTAIAASPAEAVEKYSYFFPMSASTYGNPSFTLYQFSSFIDFNIALEDGTAAGTELGVSISNGGSEVRTGTVTATDDGFGGVTARFTAAFMGSGVDQFAPATTLSSATVTLGTKSPISFGGTTTLLQNRIYQVRKGYYEAGAKYTLTADATVMENPVHKEMIDETLPISTTVATLLGTYSYAASMVTSAVVTSGENVTLGTFSAGDTPVTVSKSGTSTIKLTTSGFGDIIVTVTVTKQAAPSYKMAADAVAGTDKGKLICTDGHIHAYNADAECTKDRVAKIIYVGTTGHATYTHGLALALEDMSTKLTWDNSGANNDGKTAAEWCSAWNTSTPVTDAEWLLASKDQWNYMLGTDGASSYTTLRDGFTSVGGLNMNKGNYWSSTENDTDNAWNYYFGNIGGGGWYSSYKNANNYNVRACLAF